MMSKILYISNGPKPKPGAAVKPWFSVRNEASADCAEIMIYAQIGKSWYDEDGIGAKDFDAALKAIPTSRNILVRINSQGGNVWDGLAIYNMLKARGERVTTRNEGIAASIASVVFMAGHKREMPANSMLMVHGASALLSGNADELRKTADMLDKHDEAIASVYADHCDKTADEMREYMRAETWFTGTEAKEIGLCDDVTSEVALAACVKDFDLSNFQRVPEVLAKLTKQTPAVPGEAQTQNIMNRQQIIALLAEHGINVDNSISDADLQAKLKEALKPKAAAPAPAPAPAPSNVVNIADLQNSLTAITNRLEGERKTRITARVNELQPNRFPVAQVENWIKRAMADETVLNELAELPVQNVGGEPVGLMLELTGESLKDITNHINSNGHGLTSKFIGKNAGRSIGKQEVRDMRDGAVRVYNTVQKHRKMLLEVVNANTVDAALNRAVILNTAVLEQFSIPLLALRQFSTVFESMPLEGTDKVEVPFLDLQGVGESKSFSGTYTFTGTSAIGKRELTVGGDGNAATSGANAAAGTVKDRLYQDLSFTSYEVGRQPVLAQNIDRIFGMKGNQLGVDIFTQIVSRCIIAANYQVALTRSAAAFTSDDLANLWEAGTGANWPGTGRQVTLAHQYNTSLIKDPGFKAVYAAGNDDALRRAEIKKAYGFDDINIVPNLDTYLAANAAGWIAHMSALLVATANIIPTEEVRNLLTRFEIVQQPNTGIGFAYRRWGNAEGDASREIIECSVGAAPGREKGLQIIKKA